MANDETSKAEEVKSERGGKKKFNLILIIAVVVVLGLFVWSEYNRRDVQQKFEETNAKLQEVQQSTSKSGQVQADRILGQVRELIDIPDEPRPTVAAISDIERLKESNPFFNVAENGDYLILTGKRAILYDEEEDIVLDVAPFRVDQPSPGASPGTVIEQETETDAESTETQEEETEQ